MSMPSFIFDFKGATVMDILAWHRVGPSAITFGSLFITWFIYVNFEYTITTFVSRIFTILMIAFGALKLSSKITKTVTSDVSSCMDRFYEKARPMAQQFMTTAVHLFTWTNFENSVKFLILTLITALLGNWMRDTTLILLCIITAFTLPAAYEKKKPEVDAALAKVKAYSDKYLAILKTKGKEIESKVESGLKQGEEIKRQKEVEAIAAAQAAAQEAKNQ